MAEFKINCTVHLLPLSDPLSTWSLCSGVKYVDDSLILLKKCPVPADGYNRDITNYRMMFDFESIVLNTVELVNIWTLWVRKSMYVEIPPKVNDIFGYFTIYIIVHFTEDFLVNAYGTSEPLKISLKWTFYQLLWEDFTYVLNAKKRQLICPFWHNRFKQSNKMFRMRGLYLVFVLLVVLQWVMGKLIELHLFFSANESEKF